MITIVFIRKGTLVLGVSPRLGLMTSWKMWTVCAAVQFVQDVVALLGCSIVGVPHAGGVRSGE